MKIKINYLSSTVPCNGCRLCCQGDAIYLHPEDGDDPAKYQTEECIYPLTGKPGLMLAHKENGDCIYLGESGCTNYENRPAVCRTFDCRMMYLKTPKAARDMMVQIGVIKRAVFDAGRDRLHTLSDAERMQMA